MKDKLKLAFHSEILFCGLNRNSSRSGIFFVAFNIAKMLLKKECIEVYFYINKERHDILKNYLTEVFDNNIINIIVDESKEWINIDAFYSPSHAIPNFIKKFNFIIKYTTLHDIIPILFPEYYPSGNDFWYRIMINSINKKDYYFAVSENTKKDFMKYVKNINHITTTLLACSDNFKYIKERLPIRILDKYNIPKNKKYIFSLCTLEPRKNLIRTIKTFAQFIEKHNIDDLIFVLGGGHWDAFLDKLNKEMSNLYRHRDKIIRAGYIDDDDLSILYSRAEWFIYTSQYEGFGLPLLEAMSCGCPIIASNNSSIPEVLGNAGIMINYDSDEEHIKAYEAYYFNSKLREDMIKKSLERAHDFSWDNCVNKMLEVMLSNYNKKKIFRKIKDGNWIYFKIYQNIFRIPNFFSIIKNIFRIIYSKKYDGIYCKRVFFGIKIVTKPWRLKLLSDINGRFNAIEHKLNRSLDIPHQSDCYREDRNIKYMSDINNMKERLEKLYNLEKNIHIDKNHIYRVSIDNESFCFQDSVFSNTAEILAKEINVNNEYYFRNIDFKNGDIVMDIGGGIGVVSIFLAKKFPFLKIYAFESLKENYDNFLKNIELNNIPNGKIIVENKSVIKEEKYGLYDENVNGRYISLEEIFYKYKIKKLKLLKIDFLYYKSLYNLDINLLENIKYLICEVYENNSLLEEYDFNKLLEYISKHVRNYDVMNVKRHFVI